MQHPETQYKNKMAVLRDRSDMLTKARTFFSDRGVIEVDCPIISSAALR